MKLAREKLLFLDCQTTGMHPSLGQILEISWVTEKHGSRSFLLRLPEGDHLPHKVKEITGITEEDLSLAVDEESALLALEADLGPDTVVVSHYAQFERAFLKDMFKIRRGLEELPFPMICTHKIAQRLFPEAPSRNIRALAGYFKLAEGEIKRAATHAGVTNAIWDQLSKNFSELGIETLEQLEAWLTKTKGKKTAKIEYRVDRIKRLEFPNRPGVYRMLSQSGQVLYVGKATSLKSRVNSYFRGQKGRDRKKLEMLAQVWDIQITECTSALEAALLENEEIKRLNPPYNVSLKVGRRRLVFFSRNFLSSGPIQNEVNFMGPFPRSNAIELIVQWLEGLKAAEPAQVFYEPLEGALLREGYKIFCDRNQLDPVRPHSARELLALGMRELRIRLKTEEEEEIEEEETEPEEELPITAEDVASFYFSLLVRGAAEIRRARKLTRLLNVRVNLGKRTLELRCGQIWKDGEPTPAKGAHPWANLDMVDYDRMSVLLQEVNRNSYPVESLDGAW